MTTSRSLIPLHLKRKQTKWRTRYLAEHWALGNTVFNGRNNIFETVIEARKQNMFLNSEIHFFLLRGKKFCHVKTAIFMLFLTYINLKIENNIVNYIV